MTRARDLIVLFVLALLSCEPGKPLDPVVVILRDGQPACSGFAVGRTQIVTAAHCLRPGQISVAFATEPQWKHTARAYTLGRVQFVDAARDLAAIESSVDFTEPLRIRVPQLGEHVEARSVMFGRSISGDVLPRDLYFRDTMMSVGFGWSGSPVVGADGRVVGFVHACWATWDGARATCLEHGAVIGVMP